MSETPFQREQRRIHEQFAADMQECEELELAHRLYGNQPAELVAGLYRCGRLDVDAFEQQRQQQLKSVTSRPLTNAGEEPMFQREEYQDFAKRHATDGQQPIAFKGWILFHDGACRCNRTSASGLKPIMPTRTRPAAITISRGRSDCGRKPTRGR